VLGTVPEAVVTAGAEGAGIIGFFLFGAWEGWRGRRKGIETLGSSHPLKDVVHIQPGKV
jgi:hypothetical protein